MAGTTQDIHLDLRELAAWRGLLQTHSRLIAALDEELEREHGLGLTSYEVLLHLAGAPARSLRMSALADQLLLSRSGLTRLVDRLVGRGLVERLACPSDRRGTIARLTPEGHRIFKQVQPTHLRGVRERFIDHVAKSDLDRLATIWSRVLEAGD